MSTFKQKNQFNWPLALIILNLVLIFAYMFCILLSYDLNWMEFEKLKTHIWFLENGKYWQWSDFAKALNTKIIEIDPNRLSRPLSNLVEVIDAKFRANLWDYMPPHPTISLQWPLLFIGLPILLYKFFRNLDCEPIIALAGMGLYLTSAGFLSPIVELSHPAKSMVNFFSLLSLVIITQLYRRIKFKDVSIMDVRRFWLTWCSCIFITVITFFFDETGLFLWVVLLFICCPLFLKFKEKFVWPLFLLVLPAIYFLIIHFLLPWLHFIVNQKAVDLASYRDIPHPSSLFFPNWHDLMINFYLLFGIHPGIKWNFKPLIGHPLLITLQCVYTVAFIYLLGLFVKTVLETGKLSFRLKQIISGALLLVIFVYFHNFQLSHNVHVWTVFWYGCLFSLIYYVTLTLVLQFVWEGYKGKLFKILLPFIVIIFTAHGLMTSTYLINIFKNQRYNPGVFYYPSIFDQTINPYQYFDMSRSLQNSRCRYVYSVMYWARIKHKKIDMHPFINDMRTCPALMDKDPYFKADIMYAIIEVAYQFPEGRSFLNDPDYVSYWMRQKGEPP